jgi:hypothetical protein
MECRHLGFGAQKSKAPGLNPPSNVEVSFCKKKIEIQDPFELLHVKNAINDRAFELRLSTDFNYSGCPFFESKKYSQCPYFEA